MSITAYTNRDNELRWQIEIDGAPPAPGEIARATLQIGDTILDTQADTAFRLNPDGTITLNPNGLDIPAQTYTAWFTAHTNTGAQLAITRMQITLTEWHPTTP